MIASIVAVYDGGFNCFNSSIRSSSSNGALVRNVLNDWNFWNNWNEWNTSDPSQNEL